MELIHLVRNNLGKPYEDLEFLLGCLKEVMIESGEEKLATQIPWMNTIGESQIDSFSGKLLQLYSVCFQLLHIVEVNGAVQNRRLIEDQKSMADINGLWSYNLRLLQNNGFSGEQIADYLPQIHVEPVLTAHPTEAKRTIMLEHLRKLYLLVVNRENKMYTRIEQNEIRHNIKIAIHRIWRISDVYTEKTDVSSELDNIIHYFTQVFPEVITLHDRRLIQAWTEAGYDPQLIRDVRKFPKITFGNWVGGDRDGHPLVTSQVTRETLMKLRFKSFQVITRMLQNLQNNLSFHSKTVELNPEFSARYELLQKEIIGSDSLFKSLYPNEALRQYIEYLIIKLPVSIVEGQIQEFKEKAISYQYPSDLIADLYILERALITNNSSEIAYADVNEAIRIVNTFGFHLAKLDIRQNSRFHELAFAQLLQAAQLDGDAFLHMDVKDRLAFINHELDSTRPFTHPNIFIGQEARATVDSYRELSEHIKKYGTEALGSLIVSMTRNVSDLLLVYLLEREAGLLVNAPTGLASLMPVVPYIANDIESVIDNELLPQDEKHNQFKALVQEFYLSIPDIVPKPLDFRDLKSELPDIPNIILFPPDPEEYHFPEKDYSSLDKERKISIILDFLITQNIFLGLIFSVDQTIKLIEDYKKFRKWEIERNERKQRIDEQEKKVWEFIYSIEEKRFSGLADFNFVEISDPSIIHQFYETNIEEIVSLIDGKQKSTYYDAKAPILTIKRNKLIIIVVNKDFKVTSSSYIILNKKEIKKIYKEKNSEEPDYNSRDDVNWKERTSFERWMRIHKIDPNRYWTDDADYYAGYEGEDSNESPKRRESYHYINRLNSFKFILKCKILYFDKEIQYNIENFEELPFQDLMKLYKHYAKKSWDGNEKLEDSLCIISKWVDGSGKEYVSDPALFKSDLELEFDDDSIIYYRLPFEECIKMKEFCQKRNEIRQRTINKFSKKGFKNPDNITFINLYSNQSSNEIVNYSDSNKCTSSKGHIENALNEVNSFYLKEKTCPDLNKSTVQYSRNFRNFFIKNFQKLIDLLNENSCAIVGAHIEYFDNENIGVLVTYFNKDYFERAISYKYRENHFDSVICGSFMLDTDETLEDFLERMYDQDEN